MNKYLYYILFFVYVILDIVTTMCIIFNPNLSEMNPLLNYILSITNSSIFFLIFIELKIISFEIINYIIDYQNEQLHNIGYLTYLIILVMSLYVGCNNILLIV